tara:strand:- start:281 stop:1429 length:1149 start_codon:yes stop_codon:yes gene_type:complete
MNVLITSPISEDKFGGPVQVIHDHMNYLSEAGAHEVSFLGLVDNVDDCTSQIGKFPHLFLNRQWPHSWSYSKEFGQHIEEVLDEIDLIHGHMLWDFTTLSASRVAGKSHMPFILTPHGSVSGDRVNNSLKKSLYRRLLLSPILKYVTAMQALTEKEAADLKNFGYEGIIEVIPNGVNSRLISTKPKSNMRLRKRLCLENKRIALYLGRLWEGKGLIDLLDAWGNLQANGELRDWVLLCVGPDYRGFKKILQDKVIEYGLSGKVKISSPMYGDDKIATLDLCELFILPSHQEAFSMSILEAASRGKPVLYTKPCNFADLSTVGGGWESDDNSSALYDALRIIIAYSDIRLKEIGNIGKQLIAEKYTQEIVGAALTSLYGRLIS